jgi:hypothetical protein
VLITQGQAGAVELKELAGLLSSIAPQMKRFGVEGTDALSELGGALQVVRGGFGSGSEAVTGMQAMMNKLAANAQKFEKAGVRIFDKDPKTGAKRLRRVSELVDDISKSRLMLDPTRLQKAFGSSEAMRAFEQLSSPEGAKLWRELYEQGMESNAVARDFAKYQASSAAKMEKAWSRIKNAIADELTPERIESLAKVFSKVADAVGWAADNIETLIALLVSAKLAQGALALTRLAGAGGGLGGAASGVGKFGRALGALGGVATAGVLGYELGKVLDDALGISESITGPNYAPEASRFDPTGEADSARMQAEQLRERVRQDLKISQYSPDYGRDLTESDVSAHAAALREEVVMGGDGRWQQREFDPALEKQLMYDIRTAEALERKAAAIESLHAASERFDHSGRAKAQAKARNAIRAAIGLSPDAAEQFGMTNEDIMRNALANPGQEQVTGLSQGLDAVASTIAGKLLGPAFFQQMEAAMVRAYSRAQADAQPPIEVKIDHKVIAEATRNDPGARRR